MNKRIKTRNIIQTMARAMLLVSLVLSAFAHTAAPLHAATPDGYDARAYAAQFTLPDGTLSILCDRNGGSSPHHPGAMPCEFCSLADNAAFISHPSEKPIRACLAGLENPLSIIGVSATKARLGMHGASRAPPSV